MFATNTYFFSSSYFGPHIVCPVYFFQPYSSVCWMNEILDHFGERLENFLVRENFRLLYHFKWLMMLIYQVQVLHPYKSTDHTHIHVKNSIIVWNCKYLFYIFLSTFLCYYLMRITFSSIVSQSLLTYWVRQKKYLNFSYHSDNSIYWYSDIYKYD